MHSCPNKGYQVRRLSFPWWLRWSLKLWTQNWKYSWLLLETCYVKLSKVPVAESQQLSWGYCKVTPSFHLQALLYKRRFKRGSCLPFSMPKQHTSNEVIKQIQKKTHTAWYLICHSSSYSCYSVGPTDIQNISPLQVIFLSKLRRRASQLTIYYDMKLYFILLCDHLWQKACDHLWQKGRLLWKKEPMRAPQTIQVINNMSCSFDFLKRNVNFLHDFNTSLNFMYCNRNSSIIF